MRVDILLFKNDMMIARCRCYICLKIISILVLLTVLSEIAHIQKRLMKKSIYSVPTSFTHTNCLCSIETAIYTHEHIKHTCAASRSICRLVHAVLLWTYFQMLLNSVSGWDILYSSKTQQIAASHNLIQNKKAVCFYANTHIYTYITQREKTQCLPARHISAAYV